MIDRSEIVIHNIDLIQYHQDAIHPIELQESNLLSLWDYIPSYCETKKED